MRSKQLKSTVSPHSNFSLQEMSARWVTYFLDCVVLLSAKFDPEAWKEIIWLLSSVLSGGSSIKSSICDNWYTSLRLLPTGLSTRELFSSCCLSGSQIIAFLASQVSLVPLDLAVLTMCRNLSLLASPHHFCWCLVLIDSCSLTSLTLPLSAQPAAASLHSTPLLSRPSRAGLQLSNLKWILYTGATHQWVLSISSWPYLDKACKKSHGKSKKGWSCRSLWSD